MIRATTPPFVAKIKDVDLTAATNVYVTITQFGRLLTLTGNDLTITKEESGGVTTSKIEFYLTQDASIGFREGRAEIQVNFLYTDNGVTMRGATKAETFHVDKQLLERILP